MIGRTSRNNRCTLMLMQDLRGRAVRRPYLDRWPRLANVNFPDNREYTPVAGDSWTSLAQRFYGNSKLWWVIAEFNRVVDPFSEMQSFIDNGKTLTIPSMSKVQFDVLAFDDERLRA